MNTQIKFVTAEEAVKVIKSGDHVHLSSVASAPQCLIKAMCERGRNKTQAAHCGRSALVSVFLYIRKNVLPRFKPL